MSEDYSSSDFENRRTLLSRKHSLEQGLVRLKYDQEFWNTRYEPGVRLTDQQERERRRELENIALYRKQYQEHLDLVNEALDAWRKANPEHFVSDVDENVSVESEGIVVSQAAIDKVEAYRKSKGFGKGEFARKAQISERTFRSFRKKEPVSGSTLDNIAKAIGTTKDKLLN